MEELLGREVSNKFRELAEQHGWDGVQFASIDACIGFPNMVKQMEVDLVVELTLLDTHEPVRLHTPPTNESRRPIKQPPVRTVRYDTSYGDTRIVCVMECWNGDCALYRQGVEYDFECPKCKAPAHTHCLQIDPQFAGVMPKGQCPKCFESEVPLQQLSPALVKDLQKLSIASMSESVPLPLQQKVKNMLAAVKRYEKSRDIGKSLLTIEVPILFASMLRFVGYEEGHPASMEKHVGALSAYLDNIQSEENWARKGIVLDTLTELKKRLEFVKHDGDPLPWPAVMLAFQMLEQEQAV